MATALNEAITAVRNGDLSKARLHAEAAVDAAAGDAELATAQQVLAKVFLATGDAAGAERVLQSALRAAETAHGEAHSRVGEVLTELAQAMLERGHAKSAVPHLERALTMSPALPWSAVPLSNLLDAFIECSELRKADSVGAQLAFICSRVYGPADVRTLSALLRRGEALRMQSRHPEALAAYDEVITAGRKVSEPSAAQHEQIGNAFHNAGVVAMAEVPAEADGLFVRALQHFQEAYPSGHPSVGRAKWLRGAIALRLGDGVVGRRFQEEARALLPADDPLLTS